MVYFPKHIIASCIHLPNKTNLDKTNPRHKKMLSLILLVYKMLRDIGMLEAFF